MPAYYLYELLQLFEKHKLMKTAQLQGKLKLLDHYAIEKELRGRMEKIDECFEGNQNILRE